MAAADLTDYNCEATGTIWPNPINIYYELGRALVAVFDQSDYGSSDCHRTHRFNQALAATTR
jgi:hypothetical protein